jgi:hypothetical protein
MAGTRVATWLAVAVLAGLAVPAGLVSVRGTGYRFDG